MLAARLALRGLAARAPHTKGALGRRTLCTTTSGGGIAKIPGQIAAEVANANKSPAALYGFVGACCNWFLGISAVYDASCKGPEVISLKMTGVMICYSTLFGRWAGWAVTPRNYILAGSHMFNVIAQCNQLRRCFEYKLAHGGAAAKAEINDLVTKAAIGGAVVAGLVLSSQHIKAVVAPIGPAYLSSPGGPFTIHPWPPVTKLMISGASLMELDRPTDKISLSQYSAVRTGAPASAARMRPSPCGMLKYTPGDGRVGAPPPVDLAAHARRPSHLSPARPSSTRRFSSP